MTQPEARIRDAEPIHPMSCALLLLGMTFVAWALIGGVL
jgi:hypothetical protein